MDKCFCHLNGYEVKDAKARRQLAGTESMGHIKVSGISCKNLVNPVATTKEQNGVIFTNEGNGIYHIVGTTTKPVGFNITDLNKYPIKLEKGKTYTQSVDMLEGDLNFSITTAIKNEDDSVKYNFFVNNHTRKVEFNTNITLMNIYIDTGVTVDARFRVQLEEGTVATEYVPYFEIGGDSLDDKNIYTLNLEGCYLPLEKSAGGNIGNADDLKKITEVFTKIYSKNYNAKDKPASLLITFNYGPDETPHSIFMTQADTPGEYIGYGYHCGVYGVYKFKVDGTFNGTTFTLTNAGIYLVDTFFQNTEGGGSKGFYYTEMPIKKLMSATDYVYPLTITDIETHEKFAELIEKIVSDNVLKPYVVIANNLTSYTDENDELVENPFPRELILVNYSTFEGDGVTHYSFNGTCDVHGFINDNDVNLPRYEDVHVDIDGVWSDDKFEVSTLSISINRTQLATKKYVDDNASKPGVFEVTCTPTTTDDKTTYSATVRAGDNYPSGETYLIDVLILKHNSFTNQYYSVAKDYQNMKCAHNGMNGYDLTFEKIEGTSTENVIAKVVLGKI